MKILFFIFLLFGCSKNCDVYCYGSDKCRVLWSNGDPNYHEFSQMPVSEANSFCAEFLGVSQYFKKEGNKK
jgi:hypothetical protein